MTRWSCTRAMNAWLSRTTSPTPSASTPGSRGWYRRRRHPAAWCASSAANPLPCSSLRRTITGTVRRPCPTRTGHGSSASRRMPRRPRHFLRRNSPRVARPGWGNPRHPWRSGRLTRLGSSPRWSRHAATRTAMNWPACAKPRAWACWGISPRNGHSGMAPASWTSTWHTWRPCGTPMRSCPIRTSSASTNTRRPCTTSCAIRCHPAGRSRC
jgi:hypothetical protein